jgi:aconitate hydratase 2/2-methylisocitrate dehydratase
VSCFVCAGTGQTAYEKHVAERAAMGVVPKPISAAQCSDLVKLLENPPKGEEDFLLNLLTHRVPPGVDEAAYVKADFLTAIVKGKTKSPLIDAKHAVKLLGTMQGGYNVQTLIEALDTDSLAPTAAEVCFLNAFFLCQPCLACVERVGTSVLEHCQRRV